MWAQHFWSVLPDNCLTEHTLSCAASTTKERSLVLPAKHMWTVWIIYSLVWCVRAAWTLLRTRPKKKKNESHLSPGGVWENRAETRLEWNTADWSYGFGKFEVLFSEQFPAVNLLCLCELLLKPNPRPGQGRSFQPACREEFFSWQTACPRWRGTWQTGENESVYVCISSCPHIWFTALPPCK